jgi:formylglycine-generating enzyme required for sulfatase activity
LNTCPGGTGTGSCCASQEVPSGTYDRSYDGLSSGYTSTSYPATVSGFRLDAYEVTVGRFRQFVNAWPSWSSTLTNGAGLHTHLNGGKGLNATGGGYEPGWSTSWNTNVLTSSSGWPQTGAPYTWTTTQGTAATESLPINGVDWYEAYAFCIWDGGFLPSESEWNYAATGGSDQRVYPWSPAYPPGSAAISCTDANYSGCPAGATNAVGSEAAGNGKWGQSDLAGNVWEWTLDTWDGSSAYVVPCTDCTDLAFASYRAFRGGGFGDAATALLASYRRYNYTPSFRDLVIGFRCARTP